MNHIYLFLLFLSMGVNASINQKLEMDFDMVISDTSKRYDVLKDKFEMANAELKFESSKKINNGICIDAVEDKVQNSNLYIGKNVKIIEQAHGPLFPGKREYSFTIYETIFTSVWGREQISYSMSDDKTTAQVNVLTLGKRVNSGNNTKKKINVLYTLKTDGEFLYVDIA